MNKRIAVLGAAGHTGRFVVAELERRGLTPIPCGRGTDLDQAFRAADAVLNCAGPFNTTAGPAIEAAIRAGIPYLDVTAEVEVVGDTFAAFRDAGIPIVPAAAFYGGLGDLLATAATAPFVAVDELTIAYALSSWHPTSGTRRTGKVSTSRRDGNRIAFVDHRLRVRDGEAPRAEWEFPAPIGRRAVVGEFVTADSATIPSHIGTPVIHSFMTANAVADLRDPDAPEPVAVDGSGRSTQTFLVEVVARSGDQERRVTASGRDIYAITAPLVVEAAVRLLAGEGAAAGVATLGARFDPLAFLAALGRDNLVVTESR
ncbi:saccharopine dehydrogenase NADP-binding domain-containing protein [Actinoplanes sichuanensis]|uniref:Saccharopine dehydrogenase n=1 Tax=Actinoplanes sichuanensis TaxID=512349 RepID=A0ABW4A5F5_9ACTN|nr:saccharopine dehydrogenase [Actinoplanes sichuanensis]BEL03199.1 saccharopine dehydrogenase NADP-binding domain-containing protein [Actinoplanes sichuanensis]